MLQYPLDTRPGRPCAVNARAGVCAQRRGREWKIRGVEVGLVVGDLGEAVADSVDGHERCTRRPVRTANRSARCPSSQAGIDRSTAKPASPSARAATANRDRRRLSFTCSAVGGGGNDPEARLAWRLRVCDDERHRVHPARLRPVFREGARPGLLDDGRHRDLSRWRSLQP